jgi:hypothetical protein
VYVKRTKVKLPTSMTAIRLWRQQYVRKYIDEGKSLCIVLSVFHKSLHDEIRTYYQSCLDDDGYPYIERVSGGEGLKVIP